MVPAVVVLVDLTSLYQFKVGILQHFTPPSTTCVYSHHLMLMMMVMVMVVMNPHSVFLLGLCSFI